LAKGFAMAAKEKGYNDMKLFWYPFFFGIAGGLIVVALPDRGVKKTRDTSA
jgi:hypothetical protein